MKITKTILDSLSVTAKENPRLRMNMDLRTSSNDHSQRMLNALEPGTLLPIHRHCSTTETLIVVRGKLKEKLYDDEGNLTDCFEMEAGGVCSVLQIEKGQWHSLECLEPGTIIFEAKDGAYEPLSENDILNLGKE